MLHGRVRSEGSGLDFLAVNPRTSTAAKPQIGGNPSWHALMVAVSDGVDRKTTNNLARPVGRSWTLFFLYVNYSAKARSALYGWEVGGLDHFQYLLLMACCLLITLPLEFVLVPGSTAGLPVWRSRSSRL